MGLIIDFLFGGVMQNEILLDEHGKPMFYVAGGQVQGFYYPADGEAPELREGGEYSLNKSVSRAQNELRKTVAGIEVKDGARRSTY